MARSAWILIIACLGDCLLARAISLSDVTGIVPTLHPPLRKGSKERLKLSAENRPGENVMLADKRLLIVGAGSLGMEMIKQCKESNNVKVVAMTRSTMRHNTLAELGAKPIAVENLFPEEVLQDFDHVVFLVPPGDSAEYFATLHSAVKKWDGKGKFVFASSTSVYPKGEGDVFDERSTTDSSASLNAGTLLNAEKIVLNAGGTVLRLAGLYSLRAGEGNFFLPGGSNLNLENKILNLVSYFDAARAVLKVLESGAESDGQIYVIADGKDMTLREVYLAAASAGPYTPHSLRGEDSMPTVATTTDGGEECRRGRRLDTSKARNSLGWTPAFESFEAYCQHMAACGEQEQS